MMYDSKDTRISPALSSNVRAFSHSLLVHFTFHASPRRVAAATPFTAPLTWYAKGVMI